MSSLSPLVPFPVVLLLALAFALALALALLSTVALGFGDGFGDGFARFFGKSGFSGVSRVSLGVVLGFPPLLSLLFGGVFCLSS